MAKVIDEAEVGAEWNRIAPEWIVQVRQGLDTLRETLNNPAFFDNFIPDLRGMQVIDLGCGEGRNTRLLAGRGARMTGIDIASKMIEAAKSTEANEPLGIKYKVCSYTSLNCVQDSSFDAAISTMALMQSPQLDRTIQEAFRVLRPGGGFYFSVLHPCFWNKGCEWLVDSDNSKQGVLIKDYWFEEPVVDVGQPSFGERWGRKAPFSLRHLPYRIENYVNALCRAGFIITAMLEPRPSDASAAAFPDLLGPIYRHAPVSLFVGASRAP